MRNNYINIYAKWKLAIENSKDTDIFRTILHDFW